MKKRKRERKKDERKGGMRIRDEKEKGR